MDTDDDGSFVDEGIAATYLLDGLFTSRDAYLAALQTEAAQLLNRSRSALLALRSLVHGAGAYYSEASAHDSQSGAIEEMKDDAADLFTWDQLKQPECRPLVIDLSGPFARLAAAQGQSPLTVSYPSTVILELNGEASHGTIAGQAVGWRLGAYAVSLAPLLQLFPHYSAAQSTVLIRFLIHSHLDAEPLRGHVWVMASEAEAQARRQRTESEFAARLLLVPMWPSALPETQSFLDVSRLASCLSPPQQSRFRKELSLLCSRVQSTGPRLAPSPLLLGSLGLLRAGHSKEGVASLVLAAMANHIAAAATDPDTLRGSQSQRDALQQGSELFCILMISNG